jgi:cardiolipin synthase
MSYTLLFSLLLTASHVIGIGTALHALYYSRSSQGAIAWVLFLMVVPVLGVPAYFVLGRTRFAGYRERIKAMLDAHRTVFAEYRARLAEHRLMARAGYQVDPFEHIGGNDILAGNRLELLIDGEKTFTSIFDALEKARNYILVEFFIIKDDKLGRALQERLIRKAQEGVSVFVLFDEIGSNKLPTAYVQELSRAGVKINRFHTRQGLSNFFQVNFRNHRKIVVVDGLVAFVGGHNVGEEYLGKGKKFSSWRDTHIKIEGPAVLPLQGTFCADWAWATGSLPSIGIPDIAPIGDSDVLIVPSGPADPNERCTLLFLEAITRAKKRVWIASPYFVPDESILRALQLAAMRGVDVRVLLPEKADHLMVWLASFSYVPEVTAVGVKVFRYTEGFLHQKVFLVDDALSAVGTANLDNRSLRLNFEVTALVYDPSFCAHVTEMLTADFEKSRDVSSQTFGELSLAMKLGSKAARLFSPVL